AGHRAQRRRVGGRRARGRVDRGSPRRAAGGELRVALGRGFRLRRSGDVSPPERPPDPNRAESRREAARSGGGASRRVLSFSVQTNTRTTPKGGNDDNHGNAAPRRRLRSALGIERPVRGAGPAAG